MNTNDHTTGRNQFDQDLLMALLVREDLFNEQNNETMAQHILNSDEYTLNNEEVLRKLNKSSGSKRNFYLNSFLIAILLGGATIFTIWKFSTDDSASVVNGGTPACGSDSQMNILNGNNEEGRSVKQRDPEMVMPMIADSVAEEIELPEVITYSNSQGNHTRLYIPEPYIEDDADVPGLSETQIKLNNKRKLAMFRDIAKKKSISLVPGGISWREGKRYSVNAFYLQNSEVTNLQYTVFLNDLIIHGKTDDYLACKPVKGNWKAVNIPEFENTYSTAAGFEKFPVLNIPRAAAEKYCEWLSRELNEAIDNNEIKWSDARPDFRLPYDIEWLRAARGDDSTRQFPWGHVVNALQNVRGCYLCNFNYSISKDVLSAEGPEGNKGCISTKPNTRAVITTAGRSIDTLVTAPEYSYNPAVFGHYLLMGNAAEMVWTWDADSPVKKGVPRAMGGSWYSHADNVRIESKEQFVGVTEGNVQIGFRVVMTYQSKVVQPRDPD